MERADLRQIVQEYDLGRVVFLDEEESRPRAFVVQPADGGWRVHRTDKKGQLLPGSARSFTDEPEALAHVLASLRGEAADGRAVDVQRSRRKLPPARPALLKLRATIAEIRQAMLAHGLGARWGSIASLASLATVDDEPAADVMLAARRLHDAMLRVPRDGWSDVYVGRPDGTVDRAATAEIERLKVRLARLLAPWTDE